MARARAYVAYAQAHPGMYGLMFRTERLDMKRPALHEAADAAFAGLAGSIAAQRDEEIAAEALSLDQAAAIVRAWSLVHGFTMLLLDGRLADILRRLPKGADVGDAAGCDAQDVRASAAVIMKYPRPCHEGTAQAGDGSYKRREGPDICMELS